MTAAVEMTKIPQASALTPGLLTELIELASLVWLEVAMFGLAAIVYMFFAGGLTRVTVFKKNQKSATEGRSDEGRLRPQAPAPVRRGGRPPKKSVLAAQAAATSKARPLSESAEATKLKALDSYGDRLLPTQTLLDSAATELLKGARQISSCGKDRDLNGAIEAFEVLKRDGHTLNSLVYNCLLDACIHCGDTNLALQYFSEMKDADLADIVSFNTVMKGYLAVGDVQAAQSLLAELATRGLKANHITYHGLLHAQAQRGNDQGTWAIMDQMREANVGTNAVTCSILLKGLTRDSSLTEVARIMELIDNLDKAVDEVLFASMVESFIRTNRLDLLSERTRMYLKQGVLLKLSAPTYGAMIKAYGQAQDVERVWELWHEMSNRHVKATSITLGCMVEALVSNNQVEGAWSLVTKARGDEDLKSSLNTVIYSTILKGFSQSKQTDKVMELYNEMRTQKIPCNTITYNTVLNAFARCGTMHHVAALLEDMKSARPSVEPDLVTFSTIVKGYCMSGDVDKALLLVEEMRNDGKHAPDEVMYNSLLDGCAKQYRLEEALKLLEEMRMSNVQPSNYTLSILVKLLGRSRRLNQAFAMVETLSKEHGFRPNIQVYTCLIQACFHNRQVEKALALHDELIADGFCKPDEKTYTVLVKGCLYVNSLDKALHLVRCAYHLPGHSLPQSGGGAPPGIEARCLDEFLSKMWADGRGSLAQEIRAGVRACGAQSGGSARPRCIRPRR